jgi:hypothetical protein
MPGRESDYEGGFVRGVSAMMFLSSSDTVKRIGKTNVLQYARELVEAQKEKEDINGR